MLINRANIADMFRGFQTIFEGAWQQAPSQWGMVATEVPSASAEEHYAWLGTMPRFREWLGDRVVNSLKTHDFTIKNKDFEVTLEVDRNHIEDDKLGIYTPLVQQLGAESKTHPDELVFPLLTGGFAQTCYDGQYFFDTDHPVEAADGSMTTWSNSGGGAGTAWYLLDTRKPIKPLLFQKRKGYDFVAMTSITDEVVFSRKSFRFGVDTRCNVGYGLPQLAYASKQTLDATSFAAARASMASVKGDKGKVLNIQGNLLVVPPSLEKTALEIIKAERNAQGATNVMQGLATVMVCPWLV
ncbi:MAG: Mu-like prophage major head subunit gpT family protein [Ideonella sp.]|nr:Mu-like prophage major head subunit gpT family protein [Ideonella sp.]MCC7455985.1 Mu-like prophage major head subunit gpT family protein [Nitrospira sp.]